MEGNTSRLGRLLDGSPSPGRCPNDPSENSPGTGESPPGVSDTAGPGTAELAADAPATSAPSANIPLRSGSAGSSWSSDASRLSSPSCAGTSSAIASDSAKAPAVAWRSMRRRYG